MFIVFPFVHMYFIQNIIHHPIFDLTPNLNPYLIPDLIPDLHPFPILDLNSDMTYDLIPDLLIDTFILHTFTHITKKEGESNASSLQS